MKISKAIIGTSANTTFDGEEMVNEETQELFTTLTQLLAEYEHTTGRGLVMNLGIYSRDRKRGTSATYAHLVDAGFCDHCDELHAFPNIIPGSDMDMLLTSRDPAQTAELLGAATEEQMYTDPFGKKYLVYHGVAIRKIDENNWEQIPPRDEQGKEYPEILADARYGVKNENKRDVESVDPYPDQDFDSMLSDGRVVSSGTKTLN